MATTNDEALRGRTSARFEMATLGGIGAGTLMAGILYDGIPGVWAGLGALAFFLNAGIYGISFLIYRYGVHAPDHHVGTRETPEYGISRYLSLLRRSHIWLLAPTWIAVNAAIGVYSGQGLFNLIRDPRSTLRRPAARGWNERTRGDRGLDRGWRRIRRWTDLLGQPLQVDQAHDDSVLRNHGRRHFGLWRPGLQSQRWARSSVDDRPLRWSLESGSLCSQARLQLRLDCWPICLRHIPTTAAP